MTARSASARMIGLAALVVQVIVLPTGVSLSLMRMVAFDCAPIA
jgi:hypothetical protein